VQPGDGRASTLRYGVGKRDAGRELKAVGHDAEQNCEEDGGDESEFDRHRSSFVAGETTPRGRSPFRGNVTQDAAQSDRTHTHGPPRNSAYVSPPSSEAASERFSFSPLKTFS